MGNGPSKADLAAVSPGNHTGVESNTSAGGRSRRKSTGSKSLKSGNKKKTKKSSGSVSSKLSHKKIKPQFEDSYVEREKLGSGTFATVKRCELLFNKNSVKHEYACKIIDKKQLTGRELIGLKDEIRIMQIIQHDNVIRLFNVFDNGNNVRLIMELCTGGDLFDLILNSEASLIRRVQLSDGDRSESKHISEHYSALICYEISLALDYLHKCGVCHRDLKPENVLFTLALTQLIKDDQWIQSQTARIKHRSSSLATATDLTSQQKDTSTMISSSSSKKEVNQMEVVNDIVLISHGTDDGSGIITAEINNGGTSQSSMSAIMKQQNTASLSRMTRLKSPGFDHTKKKQKSTCITGDSSSSKSGSTTTTTTTTYTTSTDISPTPEETIKSITETPLFKPVTDQSKIDDSNVESASSSLTKKTKKKRTYPDRTPVSKPLMYRLISSLKISDFGLAHYLKAGSDMFSTSTSKDGSVTHDFSMTQQCSRGSSIIGGERWSNSMAVSSSASPTPAVPVTAVIAGSSSSSPASPRSPRSPSVTDNEDDHHNHQGMVHLMHTCCGTPHYVAPEVLSNEEYNCMVDYWSLGVILYIMLCGYQPFNSHSIHAMYAMIIKGDYSFPKPYWTGVSREGKRCVRRLMHINPRKRYNHSRLMKDEWIKKHLNNDCDCFSEQLEEQMMGKDPGCAAAASVFGFGGGGSEDGASTKRMCIVDERNDDVSSSMNHQNDECLKVKTRAILFDCVTQSTDYSKKKKNRCDTADTVTSNVLSNAMNDETLILLGH